MNTLTIKRALIIGSILMATFAFVVISQKTFTHVDANYLALGAILSATGAIFLLLTRWEKVKAI